MIRNLTSKSYKTLFGQIMQSKFSLFLSNKLIMLHILINLGVKMVHAHTLVRFQRAYILLEPPKIKKIIWVKLKPLIRSRFQLAQLVKFFMVE